MRPLPAATVNNIVTRLRAGDLLPDIACAENVSETSARRIAERRGIVYARSVRARKPSTPKPSKRIPESVARDMLRRLTAGEYICDIARACGVSEYSVRRIAKMNQIKHAVCKRGTRWGKLQKAVPVATVEAETNWTARASSLRWGRIGGGGFGE